jgi:hypothetical protein
MSALHPLPRTISLSEKTIEDLIIAHLYATRALNEYQPQEYDLKIGAANKGQVPLTIRKKREVNVIVLDGTSS